jgi:hypothetical protein
MRQPERLQVSCDRSDVCRTDKSINCLLHSPAVLLLLTLDLRPGLTTILTVGNYALTIVL